MTDTLKPEVGGQMIARELTEAEIRRRDFVDNTVHELIRRISPSGKEIELDTNTITNLREAILCCFPTGEQTFYPYLKDEAEIAHVPSLPGGTLLGLQPHHNKEFALVLTIHRDDLVQAGLPKGLAEKVSDDTLVEIGDKLGEALMEPGYWDCLRSLISDCGYGEDMVERLLEDGWIDYEFYSRGAGVPDIRRRYLFHPDSGFNVEAWRNKTFFHMIFGDTGHNKMFATWLAGIDKKLYIEIETSQGRAKMMHSEILDCSCCGKYVPNDEEHNVSHGMAPYPHDTGFGMCAECGGDKKATDYKKKIGWAACTFYEARFDIARDSLSDETQKKWDASSYELKCAFINKLLEKGIMKR